MRYVLKAEMPLSPTGSQRKSVLISVAGQDQESMFDGVQRPFEFLTRSIRGQIYARLLYGGYNERDAIRKNITAMSRAYKVGQRLAMGS